MWTLIHLALVVKKIKKHEKSGNSVLHHLWASLRHVYIDTTDNWTEYLALWMWLTCGIPSVWSSDVAFQEYVQHQLIMEKLLQGVGVDTTFPNVIRPLCLLCSETKLSIKLISSIRLSFKILTYQGFLLVKGKNIVSIYLLEMEVLAISHHCLVKNTCFILGLFKVVWYSPAACNLFFFIEYFVKHGTL